MDYFQLALLTGGVTVAVVLFGYWLLRDPRPRWVLRRGDGELAERCVITLSGPYTPEELRAMHFTVLERCKDGWRLVSHPELWPAVRRASDDDLPW